jgi:hypothetical protein
MRQSAMWLVVSGAMVCGSAVGAQAQRQAGANTLVGTNVAAASSADGVRPAVAEIVARMLEKNKERTAALEHYESERTYKVEYNGTGGEHHAELQVRMVYTGPDQKQFTVESESGSKFMCDKVLRKLVEGEQEASARSNRMQTTLGPENYDAALVGEETVATEGGPVRAWVLQVTPKVDNKFTYHGKVWVSEDDYAVVKIQGEPAKSPSWWINHAAFESDYVRRGDVWLPAKNVSSSHVRLGGEATLTIEYGTYPVVAAQALKPSTEQAVTAASFSR